ncbi:Conserved hypothetical protein [Herminiimonas arsenicoxydans]|uniref:DUF3108 domain-containing protein n=1 Tax=Herminiimonas arsenicoxydans TaxID=204773 RepID=A4G963_HERAR|nr:Conserved hypothetical protein [Herminiimonas arsenicoxydans]
MNRFFARFFFNFILAGMTSAATLSAFAQAPAKFTVNPPASADLNYTINAHQSGLTLNGTATLHWSRDKDRYSISTETRAMLLGKILEAKSEGAIDAHGLAPLTSTEKRMRKDPTTTTFNRETRSITFSASDASYPIKGGEQDRNSVVWQLATIARSTPAKFKTGANISMMVAGQKDADQWTFKVGKSETIKTSLGDLKTIKVSKLVKGNDKSQKIDIWFAPGKEWYPVRIRFAEPSGDFIEQTIAKITPQS